MATLPGTALARGDVLPGTPLVGVGSGERVRAWDFRGRHALVLCFLHTDCASCASFGEALAAARAEIRDTGVRAFAVLPEAAPSALPVLVDAEGRALDRYLGPFGEAPTVLVADRYAAAWEAYPVVAHGFPAVEEVVGDLWHLATMCDECGIIAWQ